jgi:CheY-like chemotaxis protein
VDDGSGAADGPAGVEVIVHDLNDLFAVVLNCCAVLERCLPVTAASVDLADIRVAMRRAAELTADLLGSDGAAKVSPDKLRAAASPEGQTVSQARILLVDDEPAVRASTARLLRSMGFPVLVAAGGPEALDLVDGVHEPIQLVITDQSMPIMDGDELVRRLLGRQPDLRIIVVSGAGTVPAFGMSLQKPFSRESLADAIAQVLEG